MTALPLLTCITAPIAAIAGYIVGHRRGCRDGAAMLRDELIETLARPQFWNGVGVYYLLRGMRGEKA